MITATMPSASTTPSTTPPALSTISPTPSPRLALAIFTGWNPIPEPESTALGMPWGFRAGKPKWWYEHQLPDIADLNIIHDIERHLTEAQWDTYAIRLAGLTDYNLKRIIHASSDHRATALIAMIQAMIDPPALSS